MNAKTVRLVTVQTTPTQLRQAADRMEKDLAQTRLGDWLPFIPIYGDGLEVRLVPDQDELSREKRTKTGA